MVLNNFWLMIHPRICSDQPGSSSLGPWSDIFMISFPTVSILTAFWSTHIQTKNERNG